MGRAQSCVPPLFFYMEMKKLPPFEAWLKDAVAAANEMRKTKRITKKKREIARKYYPYAETQYVNLMCHMHDAGIREDGDIPETYRNVIYVFETFDEVVSG